MAEKEEKWPITEANIDSPLVKSVSDRMLLTVVRALMESHPNPASFRESWAHCLSLMYRDVLKEAARDGLDPEPLLAIFRQIQEVWETYAPDSGAAKTKPPSVS